MPIWGIQKNDEFQIQEIKSWSKMRFKNTIQSFPELSEFNL